MLRITNGFTQMSDANLYTRALQIVGSLDGNPSFENPKPSMTEVAAALAAFNDALESCKSSDRLAIAVKNQKRQQLITLLHKLSDYVLFTSNGDKVVAISSGFRIAKSPSPRPPLVKPSSYNVKNGVNPNELISKGARVSHAVSYNHQYADDEMLASSIWTSVPSSTSVCTLPNLKSGVIYNCRMEVIGVKGQVIYSDIQRCRVA